MLSSEHQIKSDVSLLNYLGSRLLNHSPNVAIRQHTDFNVIGNTTKFKRYLKIMTGYTDHRYVPSSVDVYDDWTIVKDKEDLISVQTQSLIFNTITEDVTLKRASIGSIFDVKFTASCPSYIPMYIAKPLFRQYGHYRIKTLTAYTTSVQVSSVLDIYKQLN